MPYSILYSATKAALESITRTLAAQLGTYDDRQIRHSRGISDPPPSVLQANHTRLQSTLSILDQSRLICKDANPWARANVD